MVLWGPAAASPPRAVVLHFLGLKQRGYPANWAILQSYLPLNELFGSHLLGADLEGTPANPQQRRPGSGQPFLLLSGG